MKDFFKFFQNGGFFSIADFFLEKSVFSAKSGEIVLRFEKLSKSDVNNGKSIFCSSKGLGDIHQKRSLDKQLDSCFCESLYSISNSALMHYKKVAAETEFMSSVFNKLKKTLRAI